MATIDTRYVLAHAANLYALIWSASGKVWDSTNSVWVTFVVANVGDYDIPLTETPANSYYYTGAFPTSAGAQAYSVRIYLRAGAAPAYDDESVTTLLPPIGPAAPTPPAGGTHKLDNLGASTLVDLLRSQYGGRIKNATRMDEIIQAAVVGAAKHVQSIVPELRQWTETAITTTASTAYVAVGTSVIGYRTPLEGLYDLDDIVSSERIRWKHPSTWPNTLVDEETEEAWPKYYTIRYRDVSSVRTLVIDFSPTPDAEYNIGGLEVRAGVGDITFGTVGGPSDISYFPKPLDNFWMITAKKILALESGLASLPDPKIARVEMQMLLNGYDREHAAALDFGQMLRDNMEDERIDVERHVYELQSAED